MRPVPDGDALIHSHDVLVVLQQIDDVRNRRRDPPPSLVEELVKSFWSEGQCVGGGAVLHPERNRCSPYVVESGMGPLHACYMVKCKDMLLLVVSALWETVGKVDLKWRNPSLRSMLSSHYSGYF